MDEYRGFDSEEKPISSLIDYRASTDTAYDSEKLLVGIIDEAGKMKDPVNPIDIWDKMKPCFKEEDAIVGKCIMTTTVEEMEKGGGKKFKKIWQDSSRDPKHGKLDEFGTPISGLIQYFTPATYSYVFDQYGFSIVGDPTPSQQKFRYEQLIKRGESESVSKKKSHMGAVELLEYERKSKKTEEDRNDHRRKYPFSIKEAFTSAYKSCHFSLEKINAQEEKFLYGNPYKLVKGNFVWKDSIPDTTVVFQPSEAGKFLVSYLLPQEQSNAQDLLNGKRVPLNVMKGGAGCDPYKFSTHAQSSDPSLGAGYVWWGYDESIDGELPENEQVTDNFVVEYINRPKSREIFNEDMLMMCVYYGIKINIEVNVEHTMNYFIDRGYEGYLLFGRFAKKEGRKLVIREKDKAGQYSTGDKVKDPMFAHFEWYVENKLTQCKFPRLLEQIREVEYEDTRKYDAFMGAGYCLLGIKMINKKPSIKKEGYSSPLSVHQAAEF